MKRHAVLTRGEIYKNKNGGSFRCLESYDDGDALVQNVASGWTCWAHVVTMYDDGTIEWDYSTAGHFPQEVNT